MDRLPITTALPNLPTASSNPEPGRSSFKAYHLTLRHCTQYMWNTPGSIRFVGTTFFAVSCYRKWNRSCSGIARKDSILRYASGYYRRCRLFSLCHLCHRTCACTEKSLEAKALIRAAVQLVSVLFFQRLLGSTDATEINAKGLRTLLPPITPRRREYYHPRSWVSKWQMWSRLDIQRL